MNKKEVLELKRRLKKDPNGSFFMSLKTRERIKTLTGLFFRSGGPL